MQSRASVRGMRIGVVFLSKGYHPRSDGRIWFGRFGNLSAPSCLLVFDSWFKSSGGQEPRTRGMVISFGAGFYQASVLYRCE
jgi:predicted naringenin-chalcone synthase